MEQQQIRAILDDEVTRALVGRSPVMRVAYSGRDGAPRVVPVAYLLRNGRFVFCTFASAVKVAALRADARVAITIDTPHPDLCCLLVRGTVAIDIVEGVPTEYLEASYRTVPADQHAEFERQVRGLYDQMARFTVTPTFVRLNDFQRTAPKGVERLMAAKG
jgi:hypothetical protein